MKNDRRSKKVDACVAELEAIVASDLPEREKRKLLRNRMRGMTRRTPRWISVEVQDADAPEPHVDEHVVPLRVLAGRLLAGADARKMLSVADVTCRVSRDEDQRVSYVRSEWPDLEEQLACSRVSAARLADLGWDRYRRAGVGVRYVGHRGVADALLAKEPCPCGSRTDAARCCVPVLPNDLR
jgi:hypothetical protein